MKICKNCEKEKELTEFYTQQQKGKEGQVWKYYDSYCKTCRTKYQSERSIEIKQKAIDYLGGKCQDCGLIDIPCVYDFHHLDPSEKELAFGSRGGKSFETLKKELDKCVLLCANCHRKRHNTLL